MIKHRLMLSAAAAALLAAALAAAARADTEVSTATSTALSTSTSGNITIDATGSVGIQQSSTPAITINSNNSLANNGNISNANVDNGIGISIDTSGGNINPGTAGLSSTGTIDLGSNGTGKFGIIIQGGNTFYGPITLTTLTALNTLTGTTSAAQTSSMIIQGDSSAAFELVQGTKITSNILLGGGGIVQDSSVNSTASNSVIVDLNGTLNGDFFVSSALSGVGAGMTGIQTLGGIHSCASDTGAPAGFTCPTSSGGSFVNAGSISLIGTATPDSRGGNPEAGSAIIIGGNIDGGFVNTGPGTSSTVGAALISSSGLVVSGSSAPVLIIDPTKSITSTTTTPRGPIIIGPVTADVDAVDPGYSLINRGTIVGHPIDVDLSSAAVLIQGASSTYFTCLGTSVSATTCDTTPHTVSESVTTTVNSAPTTNTVNVNNVGGLLNTGTIAAQAVTGSQTVTANGITTATALYIGAFATVPRLDVMSEAENASANTPGSISAQVSGVGQGSAFGVILGINSNVPVINVGKNASITASVSTDTISPTATIATATAPFSLVAEAITDEGGSLKTINNAGTISAINTTLTPDTGAVVSSIETAIDLSANTTGGLTVNNSGRILGNILFGSAGNGDTLNVGNTAGGGTGANTATGVVNTPSIYAIVAQNIVSDTVGLAPLTESTTISFGSGTGNLLHVGGYGYVNAVITSAAGGVAVQVDPNGQLFVANTTTALNASTFNVANNGTLGLAISQTNLNSLTPVVQANSATLTGANLSLQFGTYISSGFTAASTASPTAQTITLIRAPVITDSAASLATQNSALGLNTPFLFETPAESGITPLTQTTDVSTGEQVLQLHLLPRSTGAQNADGSPGLDLSGQARNQFPFTAAALATDNQLGSAVATSLTVYNTPGIASSGINVAASQQQAQQVFSQFAPDVSGGTREIAIMLTDQATGPVAARQRLLRSFSNEPGDTTLWGEEFTGQINNKGRVSDDGTLTAYKDSGFGFTLGLDAGSPRNGWYGGAFTFYTGDVTQDQPRDTRTNTQWYMLTGYTDWHGKHAFLDTQLSAAYGDFDETRFMDVGGLVREATSQRPGAMLALGANTGVTLHYSGIEVDPHVSLDGLTLREEGYQEANGGPGLDLDVAPYFANSLRGALGADVKGDISLWGFDLTPEGRFGYRYDFVQDAVKIKAAFEATGGRSTAGNTMTFIGPDPDTGNAILGLSLGAHTDTWQLGVNYDWVRGNNGSTTQVGILTVLGRI
ncbi:MAG TPA: autotransporter outer membrane beta-barrel domain-containing protein [Rhizomicrobium sp.]|nr:autotransporter outer membrane beta-barrel domain-containing protein [Rhizomicrobium sp.]